MIMLTGADPVRTWIVVMCARQEAKSARRGVCPSALSVVFHGTSLGSTDGRCEGHATDRSGYPTRDVAKRRWKQSCRVPRIQRSNRSPLVKRPRVRCTSGCSRVGHPICSFFDDKVWTSQVGAPPSTRRMNRCGVAPREMSMIPMGGSTAAWSRYEHQ